MTSTPDITPQAADAPDDSWMRDIPDHLVGKPLPAGGAKGGPKGKAKAALRPVDDLAAQLDQPPIAAAAKPKPGPKPGKPDPAPNPADAPPDTPPPPRSGKPERPRGEIWKDCPVKPLGVNGAHCYYLDAQGQLRAIGKHERQAIMSLFSHRIPALCFHFAQTVKDENTGEFVRKPGTFQGDPAAMAMIAACGEKGLFDPDGAVRGVGAWSDDDGNLIYHTGAELLTSTGPVPPMTHQNRIYPAYPKIPDPMPATKDDSAPATVILDTLGTWHWQRDIDPMIALGMIGVQMLGGALDWRPSFWITGGKASGKSTFQTLIRHLHGGEKGLIQSNDATKSGLTSRIGHSSLPVALDELEPGDEGSTKERDIIVLARVASSGGQWFRGSSDQKGAGGNVYSTFMFSSILIPGALKAQDLSRLVIMTLNAFADGTPAPVLRAETWRKRGAALKHALITRWPTWAARLDLWREAFAAEGLSGRNGDNWATVLAMADMALNEALPSADMLTSWSHRVARAVRADVSEIGSDADGMLMHLMTQKFDIYRRGEQFTIGQWLMAAAQLPGAPGALLGSDTPADKAEYAKAINAKLATVGLRVTGSGHEAKLFIANAPIQGLLDLFYKSEWAKTVWKQSAARVTGAEASDSSLKLAGVPTRGWYVPFKSMPGLLSFPMDRDTAKPSDLSAPYTVDDFA